MNNLKLYRTFSTKELENRSRIELSMKKLTLRDFPVTDKDKYIQKRLEENIEDLLKMTQKTKYIKNKKRPRKDNDFGIKSVQ